MNFGSQFLLSALCTATLGLPVLAQNASPRPQRVGVVIHGAIGYLGVGVIAVDAEIAKSVGLKEERGVEVTEVAGDSPASRAGFREHDVILDYNGQRIDSTAQFQQMVAETSAGRTVRLGVFRNGSMRDLSVQIGQRSPETAIYSLETPLIPMPPMQPPAPPEMPDIPTGLLSWQSSTLGYLSEPVDGQLAEFFGVKEGVLIRSVMRQSPAEKAGLRAGDVIVKVDSTPVRSPREITAIAHRRREKKGLSLTIVRSHREIILELIALNRMPDVRCLEPV